MNQTTIRIRRPGEADRPAWDRLYQGYAEFYGVAQTPEMRDRVWSWIHDPSHETEAFVAEGNDGLVGLAHFRAFARPLSATTGGYLDDLFVAPEARGSGAAEALIQAIAGEGRARGWSVIRWITAQDNDRARRLYDRTAQATRWVTYDLRP
ncbi:GNAT family N-acetyltransferase [Rubellimicrobium arenae]|uniref:GNAT family N-acetyltransferase n=1 Tax=Rubellimicrobium arenae TaxID=2817372 RepID=UPI001B3091FC|nr:GNAT family N-acetyltransferase [Rubellimicrobium arenae]